MSIQTLEIELAEDLTPEVRKEITAKTLTIAKAIAVSMSIVGLSPDFTERRDKIVATANGVPQVQSSKELDEATVEWKAVQRFRIEMEKEEERLKRPLIDVKDDMMAMVKRGMAEVHKAEKRLSDMINGYARERAEEAERERKRIDAENAKIEADRLKAIADAAKLEQEKKDAEERVRKAQEAAEAANSPAAKAAAAEATQAAQAQADALEEQQLAAALDIPAAPALIHYAPAPTETPKGLSQKKEFDYRITGKTPFDKAKSLAALANQYIDLFTATTEKAPDGTIRDTGLRLQRANLLDRLNGRAPAFQTPPVGVETFESFTSRVR